MMRSFFTANIPDALVEAARIDGAGEYTILWKIVLPLSKPMMATISLMAGLGYWNDWMNSMYYVTDEKLYSIQAILNTIITNIQFLTSGQSSAVSAVDVAKLPSVSARMAIAVIGGLTVSTVLTLVLIPTLYCVFAGTGIKNRRRKLRRQRELDVYFQDHKDEIIKK